MSMRSPSAVVHGGAAVHRHHGHALGHPVVDPAQRQVVELGAGAAEQHDVGGLGLGPPRSNIE